ncbi:MAG: A24 family peptidase [Geminicoccaceae bacterium]
MNELPLLALTIILAAASWLDIISRRIPNSLVIAVAILWISTIFNAGPMHIIGSILTAASVLGIGMLVWRLGWLGGGDVKLIAALSLWAGPTLTPGLLLAIGASGGVLATIFLAARRPPFRPILAYLHVAIDRWLPASAWSAAATVPGRPPTSSSNQTIPYGVAAAAGGCWLVHQLLVA